MLLLVLLFTSCSFEENPFTENAFLFRYDGEFTKKGPVSLPARWSESYLRHFKFTSYYSTSLKKEIILTNMSTDNFVPSFESNFLYLKYEDKISAQLEDVAKKDFSDIRAVYDLDWFFTGAQDSEQTLKSILYDMKWSDVFLLVRPTETENADLETRLDSLCYRLLTNDFRGDIYIFFTDKSELDFSSFTFDSLCTDTETQKKFSKRYSLNYREREELK